MFEESKNADKLKLDELVNNLQTCEDNHHNKNKSKSIFLSSKHLKDDSGSDSEIDLVMVAKFVKKYRNTPSF